MSSACLLSSSRKFKFGGRLVNLPNRQIKFIAKFSGCIVLTNPDDYNNLLYRYTEVTMGTPAVTDQIITPMSATSCSEEFIVVATPRKDYYLRKEALNFTSPVQETFQFTSSELVF